MEGLKTPSAVVLQDQAGRTPLQCAAYGGYITCMAVLMENNADPNIQDKEVKKEKKKKDPHKCTRTGGRRRGFKRVMGVWLVRRGGPLSTGRATMATWTP